MNRFKKHRRGFTLIEILVVLGILAILATLVLVAVNPSRQFKIARDTKRAANVATILNAVTQNISDNGGLFMCQGTQVLIPINQTTINSRDGGFNLAPCVIPDYISAMPFDPSYVGAYYNNEADYETAYMISSDTAGRVTVVATGELNDEAIVVTR